MNFNKEFKRLILKDLRSVSYTFNKELTEQAQEDLIMAFNLIISDYYKYTPTSYRRHKTRNFYSMLQIKKCGYNNDIGMASIGINSSKVNIPFKATDKVDSRYVVEQFWFFGQRGLPQEGSVPLKRSFDYGYYTEKYGEKIKTVINRGTKGQKWVNPYWSGDSAPYYNEYHSSITVGNHSTIDGKPHEIMTNIVDNWDKVNGLNKCDKIATKIGFKSIVI